MEILRCATCGKVIIASYLTAQGKYYHPECFVCTHCRAPFQDGKFVEKEGKPYCERCYQELFMPHCDICGKPLIGQYVKNVWGDAYCKVHEREFPVCSSCQRPICAPLTRGGQRYPDGRMICTICHDSVVTPQTGEAIFDKVRRFLVHAGVDLGHAAIPLELVDKAKLLTLSSAVKTSGSPGHIFGVTLKNVMTQAGLPVQRQAKVAILRGLPWEQFTAVAAHEMGHAWVCLQGIDGLTPPVEEGFCELLGYLWLQSLTTPTSKVWMSMIQNNQEKVYREGFKMAWRSYQRKSLPAILAQLRIAKMFP
jgi:hypothetical protein